MIIIASALLGQTHWLPLADGNFLTGGTIRRILSNNILLQAPYRDKLLIAAAFLIGLLTPLFPEPYAALWGLVPLLALEAQGRTGSFLVSFSFYLALSRGIVPGAYVFFRDGSLIRAWGLWASSAAGLALPYALPHPAGCSSLAVQAARIVFAVLSSVLPWS